MARDIRAEQGESMVTSFTDELCFTSVTVSKSTYLKLAGVVNKEKEGARAKKRNGHVIKRRGQFC